jgi:NitT/TauT family transport system ATP-binding protein
MQDELLRAWEQERRTVVFITHDVDESVYLAGRVVVMSPRPGRIQEIVDVPLPYPRTEEMRLSTEFLGIRSRVWRGVHHDAAPSAA